MMALNFKIAPLLSSQPGGPPKTHKASQARYNLTRFVDSKYHGVQTCGVPGGQGKDTKRIWIPERACRGLELFAQEAASGFPLFEK